MSRVRVGTVAGLLIAGTAYWLAVARIGGVAEPWDAGAYWRIWYPLSLALSAASGFGLGRHGWMAGPVIALAQLPAMWLAGAGTGPLAIAGLLMLCAIAIPALAVSSLAGLLAQRVRAA